MSNLDEARKEIEAIDKEMIRLFKRRMECSAEVAMYKKEHGLPVLDKKREKELIEKNAKAVKDGEIEGYYREFFDTMLSVSKKYQHRLLYGVKVAYSGIEGSFAAISAGKILPDAKRVPYKNFKEAYEATERGECDLCVLPIENSYAGEVGQVNDLMVTGSLFINGVYELSVSQNLLGVKGATLKDIKTVVSHPQALEQCNEYIYDHGFGVIQSENTARAAKEVAENNDIHMAAIASKESAKLYGLKVLDHDINKSGQNTTRFAVFSRSGEFVNNTSDCDSFILMFTLKNEAGALAKAVSTIGAYGYNMHVIKSRPLKERNWEYYFYTEIAGKINTREGRDMLKALAIVCEDYKVIGSYKSGTKL